MEPIAEPLDLPPGYGEVAAPLEWEQVRGILERAPAYWLATVRPDGRPHAVPRDGFWVDDLLLYGGAPETVHHRNLAANPHVVAHVGEYAEVVVVEGTAAREDLPRDLLERLCAAHAKYPQYGPPPDPDTWEHAGGVLVLRPQRVLAWTDYPKDCTRFTFPAGDGRRDVAGT